MVMNYKRTCIFSLQEQGKIFSAHFVKDLSFKWLKRVLTNLSVISTNEESTKGRFRSFEYRLFPSLIYSVNVL